MTSRPRTATETSQTPPVSRFALKDGSVGPTTPKLAGRLVDASVDQTNGTSLRCNPLLLNKLRLIVDSQSYKHIDMQQARFGFEESRFRFYEFLLNCANFEKKAVILDVNYESIMGSA